MSSSVDDIIDQVQVNLSRLIRMADEISNEFRRAIHVDMTSGKTGHNIKLLRELLSTDNLMRDTIAKLRQATSTLNFNTDKHEILRDETFLAELAKNLTEMYSSFDAIYRVMEFEQGHIDSIVIETIESLDRLTRI